MALVSAGGMGEAVLGYGDGIASGAVNKGQDGGVFADQGGEGVLAKDIGFDCEKNDAACKGRVMEHPDALPEGALIENCQVLFARPPLLVNGRAGMETVGKDRRANGALGGGMVDNAGDTAVNCSMEAGVVNGGSHVANGCQDHLVELVIQCLDEKVKEVCMYKAIKIYCAI